ncbi:MAG: DUF1416 domain-containing protein [Candidatus Dormibacteraeota bacterium]|nr:DUF1416 domain-containing protein [Candidatus Dormibacteraeota bacterium]
MSSSCVDAPADYVGESAILGQVRKGERPVEGAYVRLTGSQDEFVAEIRTPESGEFRFWVVPGEWRVSCVAPAADRLEQGVVIEQGHSAQVDFELAPQAAATD